MSIEIKEIPVQLVAGIRKEQLTKQVGSVISASAISLLVYSKEKAFEISGRGFTIFHNVGEETSDMEVCMPVKTKGPDRGDIKFREVQGGKAAVIMVKGGYEELPTGTAKLQKYCSDNNLKWKEIRNVYVKGPQETSKSEAYETEIQAILS